MKNLYIAGMMALAAVSLTSCQADTEPVFSEATEFVLNTPPFADQLYQLQSGSVIELTCSQPNYGGGLALAPEYGIEISLLENFGEGKPAPEEDEAPLWTTVAVMNPHSAVIEIEEQKMAAAISKLMGLNDDNYQDVEIPVVPVYVRATANINNQPSTMITSNTIELKQVLSYYQPEAKELDVIYAPGNANGWSFDTDKNIMLLAYGDMDSDNKYTNYRGLLYLNGDFKFTGVAAWDDSCNWGLDPENPEPGHLMSAGNSGNIPLPSEGAGLYYVTVNTKDLTYTLTYVASMSVCGAFNGWNAEDAATHMTPSADYLTWTYEGTVDGEFKFLANDAWTVNLGGDLKELAFDGGNINAGVVSKITLDLSTVPYKATVE